MLNGFSAIIAHLVLIYTLVNQIHCARIFAAFPVPSISHQVVFRPLTQELAKRGHEVIILTPDPAFPDGNFPPNLTEIDVHNISYTIWRDTFVKRVDGDTDNIELMRQGLNSVRDIFEYQLQTEQVQNILNSDLRFDLILTEACINGALVFSHVLKAPLIQVSSFTAIPPNFQVIGAPSHLSFFPESVIRWKTNNLSLIDKIIGVYEDIFFRYLIWCSEDKETQMLRRVFGQDVPDASSLRNNVEMLFLNIHPIWEFNRPVPPGVVFMGGLHQKPQKELPKELKSYLDSSKHGVIYMSFGTNVNPSLLPPERIAVFCTVFARLPYDILWKWDKEELHCRPENVKISKWLPQSDLLRHPNIKLFITQAGLQSTDEAITAGVPLLAFPMLADQYSNADKYETFGIGFRRDLESITEESLLQSINELIENKSYRKNIENLRNVMRDQPQPPLERAIWWIEYVIRHGGAKHLRTPMANISWAEYLILDVVIVLVLALVLVATILFNVTKRIIKAVLQTQKLKTS